MRKINKFKPPTSTLISIKGAALTVLAAFLFSCVNVVIRISGNYFTIWHIMLGRSIFGVVFLMLAARISGVDLIGQKKPILLILGFTGTAAIVCLTLSLVSIPLYQAIILFYTYPVVAALVSPWLTSDTTSFKTWICIGIAFTGTILTIWSDRQGGLVLELGHLSGVAASLLMGITLTLVRRVSTVNSSLSPIFYISVTSIIISLIPLLNQNIGFTFPLAGMPWLLAVSLFAVLAHITTNKALSFIDSARVGSIGMLEVPFGAVGGYLIFAESLGWSSLIGGTLIVIAGLGLVQGNKQTDPVASPS